MKKSLANRSVVVAAAIAASVGSVGGIAYALTSGSSTPLPNGAAVLNTSTTAGSGSSGAAGTATPSKRGSRIKAILGHAVRVQVVVPKSGGGYQTVDLDRGSVTALSSTSITVAPLDGSSPVTATITSSTHEPKNVTITEGENVVLLSSDGDALLIRPMRTGTGSANANGTGVGTGSAAANPSTTSTTA